jgi:hypothetical protein
MKASWYIVQNEILKVMVLKMPDGAAIGKNIFT